LYEDAVQALGSIGYSEYLVLELFKTEGRGTDTERVLHTLQHIERMLELGGDRAMNATYEAHLRHAIEAAICRLALDPLIPIVDKEVRLLARLLLQRLR
jgi:hypothetical protein